ncbi:MAG: ATP-binding protein [Gammaproteobacteria bacterium]|nr:ATP-binding protein [Gammaproteobacteria bacterium]
MKRDRLQDLEVWRFDPYRKPLLIRGCRQVGKSWLVREFGKQFESFIEVNFEKNKSVHSYFETDLDINALLEKLTLYSHIKIEPGKTLLFFDEIQACEGALQALRYFKEDRPDIHIIAAGSLLDFTLSKLGIAVGRVQFMHLYPLSFSEYLTVLGLNDWREFLFKQENDPTIATQLIEHLKNYMWLGGMPAVISAWLNEKTPLVCQARQDEIIESYQIDFYKYAKQHEITHVSSVFNAIPQLIGKKFVYANVDEHTRGEIIKKALNLLEMAGIAIPCYHTAAQQPPLSAMQNNKKFKIYYFDIGIAQRLLGLDIKQWSLNPLRLANQGGIAEQFVAQELVAYSDFRKQSALFYWSREAKSSHAEVDFIVLKKGELIPVEVKSSQKGSMKSMHLFLESHPNSMFGLKISTGSFAHQEKLIEIPLYAIESWANGK